MKAIEFVGNSLDDLREFPIGARRDCGYQLDRVQHGFDPSDWKPMPAVGSGVREIRVREQGGAVIYVAKLADRVYVLQLPEANTEDGEGRPRPRREAVQADRRRGSGQGR